MSHYDYRIGTTATATAGTGTVSNPTGTDYLIGLGTLFLTELAIGDLITAGGVVASIISIVDNETAHMAVIPTAPFAAASYTINKLTNVERLTPLYPFAPKSRPRPWYQGIDLGDGLARGMGRPVTVWSFGYVTQAFRDALRAYCPGKSARVFIRTRDIDHADGYNTYEAALIWPEDEQRETTRRLDFALQFRDLVLL